MKPSIPKGTRDFNPEEVGRRNYIFDTIKKNFSLYGFQPIETPSFENSETLMGKYGEEGDRLIFKILNSGDYFKDLSSNIYDLSTIQDSYSRFIDRILDEDEFPNDEQFKNLINLAFATKNQREIVENFILDKKSSLKSLFFSNKNEGELSFEKNDIRYLSFIQFQGYYLDFIKNSILNSQKSISKISEKALRYDLTVPFARYVVQHRNEITFPFKRYQIQPVWRADRPQKGRFREFYQCDADVVGSKSLWQEVEFIQLYDAVFTDLGLKGVTIKINNRKILAGIAETIGAEDKLIDFTVALDKLDKIGEEGVKKEMREKGIPEAALEKLQPLFSLKGSAIEQLQSLRELLINSTMGTQGVEELEFISKTIETLGLRTASLQIDVTLARGLNYYTGAILEVSAPEEVNMGSIGGGGRYDDLTSIFGLKDMSGMGISFGLDRIYLVLEELNLFPETISENSKALFLNFGEQESLYAMKAIKALRVNGVAAELYPDAAKMGKQMGYADKRDIPFTVLAGQSEIEQQVFTLKNMKTGEQRSLDLTALKNALKS